jgi:hypothetical protein
MQYVITEVADTILSMLAVLFRVKDDVIFVGSELLWPFPVTASL